MKKESSEDEDIDGTGDEDIGVRISGESLIFASANRGVVSVSSTNNDNGKGINIINNSINKNRVCFNFFNLGVPFHLIPNSVESHYSRVNVHLKEFLYSNISDVTVSNKLMKPLNSSTFISST